MIISNITNSDSRKLPKRFKPIMTQWEFACDTLPTRVTKITQAIVVERKWSQINLTFTKDKNVYSSNTHWKMPVTLSFPRRKYTVREWSQFPNMEIITEPIIDLKMHICVEYWLPTRIKCIYCTLYQVAYKLPVQKVQIAILVMAFIFFSFILLY